MSTYPKNTLVRMNRIDIGFCLQQSKKNLSPNLRSENRLDIMKIIRFYLIIIRFW